MKTSCMGRYMVWILVLLSAICAYHQAQASWIRDPVAIEMSVELTPLPFGFRYASLSISVTAFSDAPKTSLSIELPPEIEWLKVPPAWSGDLRQGESFTLRAPIRIAANGRFSITTIIRTPENLSTSSHHHLNFIVEGNAVEASMDPFILMDLRRARTPEERRKILSFPARTTTVFLNSNPEPGGTTEWTATISGKAEYRDFEGNKHPIRFAKVEIINEDPDAEFASLGRCSTNADGTFSIAVSCSTSGVIPDVRVCVYSRCAFGLFTGVCPTAADPDYTLQSEVIPDCPQGVVRIDLLTGQPVVNRQDDDTAARAFSVLDAILQANLEGYCILLEDGIAIPPDYIETHFPAPSCYNPTDHCIQIARNDALDWDIIYHEYFHYFSRHCARTEFNDGPGGQHDGSSAIPEIGKDNGLRLAWDEAIASFMAVVTQLEDRAGQEFGLDHPALPCMGNAQFENIEGSTWSWDLETEGHTNPASEGYGSEISVLSILYDLWDQGEEKLPDTNINCSDRIGLPLQTIWSLWNTGTWDDATKFYGYISALLMNADPNTLPYFSDLYAMNRIAPLASSPVHNATLSRAQIPTFTWIPNGDRTPGYMNDHFILGIFKNGLRFDQCIFIEPDLRVNSWTPTKDQWESISKHATNSTRFYWYVMGWNEKDFHTPPTGPGLGSFVSNVQSFTFRPNIFAHGMMGCPDKPATLFFNGFPLEVNPYSNEYPFHGVSSGHDYNGAPIYFILDGRFFLEQSMVQVDIEMYSDPSYTVHIRTDRAEAYSWNEWFYDLTCNLTRDTSAGCRPLWFAVKFTENQSGTEGGFYPRPDMNIIVDSCPGTLGLY